MAEREAWRWLAQHGHHALSELNIKRTKPLQIDWSGTHWHAGQQILLEEQLRLRQRSRERFPDPENWLWTDRSMQQASDWNSAVFKADLFAPELRVVDACCGAGADLVALAARHEVVGLDRDERMLWLAQANLRGHGLEGQVCRAELPAALRDLSRTALHIDPDRRSGEDRDTRTTQGEAFSPTLSEAIELGDRAAAAIIKLAPATQLGEDAAGADWRRCWIGTSRECPQQLLVRGALSLAIPAGQVASILVQRDVPALVYSGVAAGECAVVTEVAQYIYEPIPSMYAAGLAADWADEHDMAAIATPRGYFTGDQLVEEPWANSFRVLDFFAWDDRRMRKWLRAHGAGPLEIKCRLVPMEVSDLQRRYSQPEGRPLVCLLTRIGKSVRAIMAERTSV